MLSEEPEPTAPGVWVPLPQSLRPCCPWHGAPCCPHRWKGRSVWLPRLAHPTGIRGIRGGLIPEPLASPAQAEHMRSDPPRPRLLVSEIPEPWVPVFPRLPSTSLSFRSVCERLQVHTSCHVCPGAESLLLHMMCRDIFSSCLLGQPFVNVRAVLGAQARETRGQVRRAPAC